MKLLNYILAILFLNFNSFGQTDIQLVVKNIGKHKINKVDVFDLSQEEFHEVPYKDTLNFRFAKNNIDCYNIRYHENGKIYRQQIWLDPGQITIEAHIDTSVLVIDSVLNSPTYYHFLKFKQNYSTLLENKDTTAMTIMLLDLYSKYSNSPYSFVFADLYISLNKNSKSNLSKLKLLTDKQGEEFSWFLLYPAVVERLNNILAVSSIRISDYTFINGQNQNVKISALTKDYYILDFWFLNCAPCIRDHKEIFKEQKKLSAKNAEVIGISIDSDVTKWNIYLSKNKYTWPNYLESKSKKITEKLSIGSFPTYIIIDKSGNILSLQDSFSDVLNWLDNI